jgi:class 3 adenylate cyclase/DNA-binding transcriptional MerR regulator
MMLTSFEVMEAANISRATLNNYISQGLLPRPLVKNPEPGAPTSARQIGYFPKEVLARLERINQLKKDGYSMAEIAKQLEVDGFQVPVKTPTQEISEIHAPLTELSEKSKTVDMRNAPRTVLPSKSNLLRLTIDHIPYPAYMVNYNFEITWFNEEARSDLLGAFENLPADIKERNALSYLLKGRLGRDGANREELLQFYLLLGKGRFSRNDLMNILTGQTDATPKQREDSLAELRPNGTLVQLPLTLRLESDEIAHYNVYASYYREGILFIHLPTHAESDSLLGLLERRDEVIRNLLKKHLPVLTDVAVLVADLQSSVRICTELPPEEYFELINQIWATMEPIFRKYYGTHGKHVGDGMVYYFFPQPDCNYILNALMCAQEMKAAMRKISKEWQLRKNWMNDLYLNTGLNEGHEWLGIFHIETKVEFTVLGDTINHAARLSDFARGGAIWATKNLLGKLPTKERQRVKFGIRRQDAEGHEVFVGAFYSRINELAYLNDAARNEKLNDIAALPVTEIMEIED